MFDFNHWLNRFPGTNFHELNIDWIVEAVKELAAELGDFEVANTIHYAGPFDITKQYSAWSIVVDNNLGYISIKPVPAGISLDNTEYWQNIADFTALYADLGEQVEEVRHDLNQISNNDMSDRIFLFVGDSYMTGWSPDGTASPKYYETFCSNIGVSSYYAEAEGGCGFTNARPYKYIELFQRFVSNHPSIIPTDVFLIGGYNDNTESASEIIYNARTTFDAIKNTYPDASIYLGYIGRGAGVDTARSGIEAINKCVAAYKKAAALSNIRYIKDSEFMLHDYKGLSSDGIHPNQTGHNAIGNYMAQQFLIGTYDYDTGDYWHRMNIDRSISGTNKTNLIPGTWTIPLFEHLGKSGVTIQSRKVNMFTFDDPISSITLDGNKNTASLTLGKYTGNTSCRNYISNFRSSNEIAIPVQAYMGAYHDTISGQGTIVFDEDGTVSIVFTVCPSDGEFEYKTIEDVIGLIWPPFEFTIPLDMC